MHDTRDDTNYQVPTGKKAKIIYVELATFVAGDQIYYADNADGSTNKVVLFEPAANVSNTIFISASIPADKFINVNDSGDSTAVCFIIEEAA